MDLATSSAVALWLIRLLQTLDIPPTPLIRCPHELELFPPLFFCCTSMRPARRRFFASGVSPIQCVWLGAGAWSSLMGVVLFVLHHHFFYPSYKDLIMNTDTIVCVAPAIIDEEAAHLRHAIKQAWKEHAKTRTATAAQHAALGLLLGRDLNRMFTPITNSIKLAHGAYAHEGRDTAIAYAVEGHEGTWAPFAALLEGAQKEEKWGRTRYLMHTHPLLAQAVVHGAKT